MPLFHRSLTLPDNLNRREIRRYVVDCFLDEEPGHGKKELTTKYIYEVEKCLNRNVFISRPANLNKGMDFTVHVEDIRFRPKYAFKDRPKHEDIFQDLIAKKQKNESVYKQLAKLLKRIYLCEVVSIEELRSLTIDAGVLTCEETCLAIKWLFIEQDITYWNWSGRAMFYNGLLTKGLVD